MTFSVNQEYNRTTSSLECYNSHLNRKLKAHGNFFEFNSCIQTEELTKFRELQNSLDGVLDIFEPRKKKYKTKDDLIQKCMKDLQLKKISVKDFLNQVANNGNKITNSDFEFINIENYGKRKCLFIKYKG